MVEEQGAGVECYYLVVEKMRVQWEKPIKAGLEVRTQWLQKSNPRRYVANNLAQHENWIAGIFDPRREYISTHIFKPALLFCVVQATVYRMRRDDSTGSVDWDSGEFQDPRALLDRAQNHVAVIAFDYWLPETSHITMDTTVVCMQVTSRLDANLMRKYQKKSIDANAKPLHAESDLVFDIILNRKLQTAHVFRVIFGKRRRVSFGEGLLEVDPGMLDCAGNVLVLH